MTEWINGISKPKVYEIEDFLDDVKDSRIEALERENARLRERLLAAEYVLRNARPDSGYWDTHAKEALA